MMVFGITVSGGQGAGGLHDGNLRDAPVKDVYWWSFAESDCGYDDINTTCTGSSLDQCKCRAELWWIQLSTWNNEENRLSTKDRTSDEYIKSNKPQPPNPPPPPTWPMYDAINVWPMPTNVTLCSESCKGPHMLVNPQINVDSSCSDAVKPLALEAVKLATAFKAPTRTYDEGPYSVADSFCSKRCSSDSDCSGFCYIPSDRKWSSKGDCPPSSKYNSGCGCCISDQHMPQINFISVTCGDSSVASSEGYTLSIEPAGIIVSASADNGAAYGLTTLAQLIRYDTDVKSGVLDFVPLKIFDSPKYSWRGHMLDTSRHFIPVEDILTLLDGMYAAKMNTFHWHIVDSPSFPMSSINFPELALSGSWTQSNASIYSQSDIQMVAQRARERFVELVLEIDTPAHTLAIGKSHPEMMSQCWEWMATSRYKVDVDSDDCMALNPTMPKARSMIASLLEEAAEIQGAESKYLHIGGDEVKFPCWNSDPSIAAYVNKTYGDTSTTSYGRLQAEWTANVSAAAVVKAGKRPVLWQPTTQGPGDPVWDGVLPSDSVYMIWLNSQSAQRYAQNGSSVVYTTPFYVAGMGSGGWLSVYNAQIMPENLTPEQEKNILGAEICMWGESLDVGNLGVRGFQIGAAAAENFWKDHPKGSGPGSAAGLGLSDRYNHFLCHLRRFGIDAAPIMPSSCEVVGA